MSALGHYLEEEGIATVSISLIRPQTERTRPPRALWVPFELGRPLGPPSDPTVQRRVAIVSSAGLVRRGEEPFRGRDADFRVIPGDVTPEQLLVSHISINFDRTGFQEDRNVVFPLDRLNKLAAEGVIGSVAATHYAFMGATDPVQMEPYAREVAGRLKQDQVDAVILTPV